MVTALCADYSLGNLHVHVLAAISDDSELSLAADVNRRVE